jgi:hypothetical protein
MVWFSNFCSFKYKVTFYFYFCESLSSLSFSPYFQRIFSENPCKHPVIVLKDLRGWEVQAIVDFMYKGEISVVQEQLSSLIKAAESLQVSFIHSYYVRWGTRLFNCHMWVGRWKRHNLLDKFMIYFFLTLLLHDLRSIWVHKAHILAVGQFFWAGGWCTQFSYKLSYFISFVSEIMVVHLG